MRHGKAGNRLSRNQTLRKATVRDLAKATLIDQRICTTKAKAKEARKLVDRLITLGKKGTLAHRRKAFSILCDHQLVRDLFSKTAPRFQNRFGGYTRIIPLATARRGDAAHMVLLELTEKEVIVSTPKVKEEKAKEKSAGSEKSSSTPSSSVKGSSKAEPSKPKTEDKAKAEEKKSSIKSIGGLKRFFRKKIEE